jgi:hypothetical protein
MHFEHLSLFRIDPFGMLRPDFVLQISSWVTLLASLFP